MVDLFEVIDQLKCSTANTYHYYKGTPVCAMITGRNVHLPKSHYYRYQLCESLP